VVPTSCRVRVKKELFPERCHKTTWVKSVALYRRSRTTFPLKGERARLSRFLMGRIRVIMGNDAKLGVKKWQVYNWRQVNFIKRDFLFDASHL